MEIPNKQVDDLQNEQTILKKAYHNFNHRNIDRTLETMHAAVDWPNGMEGGFVHGHDEVRSYWTRQWTIINPRVEPLEFGREADGRINVTVHQVVHDLAGNKIADQVVHHVYEIEYGLIRSMEIV